MDLRWTMISPPSVPRFHQVVTSRQLGQLAATLGGWSGARVAEDQAPVFCVLFNMGSWSVDDSWGIKFSLNFIVLILYHDLSGKLGTVATLLPPQWPQVWIKPPGAGPYLWRKGNRTKRKQKSLKMPEIIYDLEIVDHLDLLSIYVELIVVGLTPK